MDEVTGFAEIVETLGIPVLFFIIMLLAIFKFLPHLINEWKTDRELQRKQKEKDQKTQEQFYKDMQEAQSAQIAYMTGLAEQTNRIMTQSVNVMSRLEGAMRENAQVVQQNTAIHHHVLGILQRDVQAQEALGTDFKTHDRRTEKIQRGVDTLLVYQGYQAANHIPKQ